MIVFPPFLLEKNPVIIFIHGWNGSSESNFLYVKTLAQKGYCCVNFDLPGHGKDKTNINLLTRENFLEYILTIYDSLLSIPNIDIHNINVMGSSFGAYLSILLSTRRKIKRLALRVPANYPDEGFNSPQFLFSGSNEKIISWRKLEMDKKETKSLNAISVFKGPILIVESEKDDLIPHQTIQNYIDATPDKNKLTYIVMKNAEHRLKDLNDKETFSKILSDWF